MTNNERIALISGVVAVITAVISSFTTLQASRKEIIGASVDQANINAVDIVQRSKRRIEAGESEIVFPLGFIETGATIRFSKPFETIPIVVISECRGDGNWMSVKTNTADKESFSWVGLLQYANDEGHNSPKRGFVTHVCWIAIEY